MSTESNSVQQSALELCIAQNQLPTENAVVIRDAMTKFFVQAEQWKATVPTVTDPKVARASRLALKGIRVDAKHKKDELKETVLKVGRAIDGAYRLIEDTISPMEAQLEAVEKKAEREEAERKAKIRDERASLLAQYGVGSEFYDLANMPAEAFAQLLEGSKIAHEAKLAAAKKSEEERIAREKAEAAERERVRVENERLKKEAFEQAKRMEEERAKAAAVEEKLRREREEADKKAREEKAALEAKARKAQEAANEQARKEREARERAEAELAKAKAAEAARVAAEEQAKQKAALAPDREKVLAFAVTVSAEANALVSQIREQVEKFAVWVEKKGGEL